MRKLLKYFPITIMTTLITMLSVYVIYSLYHFGFGQVIKPDWFTGYDSKGYPEPFPFDKVIQYWSYKGQLLALKIGIITFIGIYIFIRIKSKRTKNIDE